MTDTKRKRKALADEIGYSTPEEMLAYIAADIRKGHTPEEFPTVIAGLEPWQPPGVIAALRRALYS